MKTYFYPILGALLYIFPKHLYNFYTALPSYKAPPLNSPPLTPKIKELADRGTTDTDADER